MKSYPPIRCSASIRELTLAVLTRDHASSTSHTLIPPRRTKAKPIAILAEGVIMFAIPHVPERWIGDRDQSPNGSKLDPTDFGLVKQRGWPRLKCEGRIETRASLLDKCE